METIRAQVMAIILAEINSKTLVRAVMQTGFRALAVDLRPNSLLLSRISKTQLLAVQSSLIVTIPGLKSNALVKKSSSSQMPSPKNPFPLTNP